jgi:hypothetical protein
LVPVRRGVVGNDPVRWLLAFASIGAVGYCGDACMDLGRFDCEMSVITQPDALPNWLPATTFDAGLIIDRFDNLYRKWIRLPASRYASRSGNLNREWTPMDANELGGDFIRGRALSDDDLSPVHWPRRHRHLFACIRVDSRLTELRISRRANPRTRRRTEPPTRLSVPVPAGLSNPHSYVTRACISPAVGQLSRSA